MPLDEVLRLPNKLLAALSAEYYSRLNPFLEFVELPLGKILYHQKQSIKTVYFPRRAVVSMVNVFENGTQVEVGVIGREGVVGHSLLSGDDVSPHQAVVQIADGGWRMDAAVFRRELDSNGELSLLTRRYAHTLFTQVAQTAACNRVHSIAERLPRWLLLTQDRLQSETLNLTHEFMATMLGVRRASVTLAASKLQSEGIIRYSRGKVTVLDRNRLEDASCECHRIVRAEYSRLMEHFEPQAI